MPEAERIRLPDKIYRIRDTRARYVVLYGGRGGAKSWGIAILLLLRAGQERLRVLCTREIQNTIRDSVHKLLADTIYRYGLEEYFTVQNDAITSCTGSEFIFKGLRHNINDIKSTEGIDICWVEEAQAVSKESWDVLIPTIRKDGSQFFIIFNPHLEDDPTYQGFVKNPREDSVIVNINYTDNPFFPEVLRKEMEYDKRTDYEKYIHVWLGGFLRHSDALVFKGKFRSEAFETPGDAVFYYGADWGFANDPTVMIRCFVVGNKLYIDHEVYGIGVEIVNLPEFFRAIPGAEKSRIKADSARPETISHMRRNGFPHMIATTKGPKSVEDGIEFMRSFEEIVVHERCRNTLNEFRFYSYKTDKLTGNVLPVLVDKDNHCIDSIRYALEDAMMNARRVKRPSISIHGMGF